jgi:hypothetical protein
MKFTKTPDTRVLSAVVHLLRGSVPNLTEAELLAALREHDPDAPRSAGVEFWTKAECVSRLKVSPRTVNRMVADGLLPIVPVGVGGRDWRVCATALAEMAECTSPEELRQRGVADVSLS